MQLDTIATRYILYFFDNFVIIDILFRILWIFHGSVVHNKGENNYSYLMVNLCVMQWAEVLSADAFSAFEDAGLDNNKVYLIKKICQ